MGETMNYAAFLSNRRAKQIPMRVSISEAIRHYRDRYEWFANIRLQELIKEQKFEDARDLLEKIIVVVSDKPASLATSYMKLGIIYERLIDFERAEAAYRSALLLEPTDKQEWYFAHNNLGFSLNQLERYEEAEVYCRQAIEIEPARHNAYKNLGVALAAQGEHAEAAKLFVRATILCPHDGRALSHLEQLLDEHEIVYLQLPEIEENLERCRKLVSRKERGGVQGELFQ